MIVYPLPHPLSVWKPLLQVLVRWRSKFPKQKLLILSVFGVVKEKGFGVAANVRHFSCCRLVAAGREMVAVHCFFAVRWIQAPTKEMNVGISFHGGFLDPASRA